MRAKPKGTFADAMKESTPHPPPPAAAPGSAAAAMKEDEWEVRLGGMLVQKRSPDADAPAGAPVPTIRVKVKFNGVYHEIYINSQASFGKLQCAPAAIPRLALFALSCCRCVPTCVLTGRWCRARLQVS
jgi:hypothetical protein